MLGKISRTFVTLGIIVLAIVFYLHHFDHSGLEGLTHKLQQEPKSVGPSNRSFHPTKTGLNQLIGQSEKQIKAKFGKPARIEPSAYGYHWWVYNKNGKRYIQAGVENGKVVSLFVAGNQLKTGSFTLGEKTKKALKGIPINKNVSLQVDGNSYQFELTAQELNDRPLVRVGNAWAILYFDHFVKKLVGIRYLDGKTLVKLRPYSVSYRGQLISPKKLNHSEWKKVEGGEDKTILDITNLFRKQYQLGSLRWSEQPAKTAFSHSKDMAVNHYFSHTSPTAGGLAKRLHHAGIHYWQAGENIAAHYPDAVSAMYGWLNSKGHRENLLHKAYTGLGVGVYEKYYTQDFIKPF